MKLTVHWWCMLCADHGEGDNAAANHTKKTTHPTMTSIHPRPTAQTDDVRFHEVPD